MTVTLPHARTPFTLGVFMLLERDGSPRAAYLVDDPSRIHRGIGERIVPVLDAVDLDRDDLDRCGFYVVAHGAQTVLLRALWMDRARRELARRA